MKHRVLLSNDDGIDAAGIRALYDEISRIANVTLVAPSSECSGVGHAISLFNNLTLEERKIDGKICGYGLAGTPADCVKFAITRLMKEPPHLVISGINRGQNTGNSILYSGTVAAAIEGLMFGIPSMAVSLAAIENAPADYGYAARFTTRIAALILEKGLPEGILLNINIPNLPEEEIHGVVISKQGRSTYTDYFEPRGEHEGLPAFRNVGGEMLSSAGDEDYDDIVLSQNKISITPLGFDLTHHDLRMELERWMRQHIEDELSELARLKSNPQI